VVGRPRPGLPHTWVQPEIADQLLRSLEARDVADRRLERERYDHVNAWDRHQARDALVRQRRACEIALDHLEVLAEPIELAQVPLDRKPLILRHDLLGKPRPPSRPAQILMRAGRDQVRVQDRLNDVLQAGALAYDLVATRDLPAQRLGWLVGDPDLGQEAAGI
jgi:hypothetical protein